jgi:hypothetical protein
MAHNHHDGCDCVIDYEQCPLCERLRPGVAPNPAEKAARHTVCDFEGWPRGTLVCNSCWKKYYKQEVPSWSIFDTNSNNKDAAKSWIEARNEIYRNHTRTVCFFSNS